MLLAEVLVLANLADVPVPAVLLGQQGLVLMADVHVTVKHCRLHSSSGLFWASDFHHHPHQPPATSCWKMLWDGGLILG